MDPSPIIPVKTLILPSLKKSVIDGQNTFQIEGVKHRGDRDKILKLVGELLVQAIRGSIHEEHGDHALRELREGLNRSPDPEEKDISPAK